MSKLSPKLDEVNTSYACKLNSILRDFYDFINLSHNYPFFQKIRKNEN